MILDITFIPRVHLKKIHSYLDTLYAHKGVVSHSGVSVWVPNDGVFPSCIIKHRKLPYESTRMGSIHTYHRENIKEEE